MPIIVKPSTVDSISTSPITLWPGRYRYHATASCMPPQVRKAAGPATWPGRGTNAPGRAFGQLPALAPGLY